MKGFYAALGVVCVAGAAWLAYGALHKSEPALGPNAPVPVAVADGFRGFTLGSDSAPVEVTEYSDFECPWCAAFAAVQMPVVREQLIATGKVRWRYREFPLNVHKYSRLAALAGECAGEQGKFWEMHDRMFGDHQWADANSDPTDVFRGFAKDLSLDLAKYDQCIASQKYAGRIEASYEEGEARGVQGTPTFFVDGRKYQGRATSDALKALVDSLIAARHAR
jgi:protein-disulfide isomerase